MHLEKSFETSPFFVESQGREDCVGSKGVYTKGAYEKPKLLYSTKIKN